jgi:phosphoribosyl 1,2-cyclic phosphate phosphodiesterase
LSSLKAQIIKLKVTFLGTGTSQGIPVIGCDCPVCQSNDPRDKRLRTSVFLEIDKKHIIIDTGPDFRQQMLRKQVKYLDAVLITHDHNDHIIGIDDIRPFNFMANRKMPVYASKKTAENLNERFSYVFAKNPYPGAPMIDLIQVNKNKKFKFNDIDIVPIEALHGKMPVMGYRIGDFTYLTDVKTISDKELKKVSGSKVLVLNALHRKEHHSHLNLEQALELIEKIKPQTAYLIHLSHNMGFHAKVARELPENVYLAYDGLSVRISTGI